MPQNIFFFLSYTDSCGCSKRYLPQPNNIFSRVVSKINLHAQKALTGWNSSLYHGCFSQYFNLCPTRYFYLLVQNTIKLDWIFLKIIGTRAVLWSAPEPINLHGKILRFLVTRLSKNHQLSEEERHKSSLLFAKLIGALFFLQDPAESAWLVAKGCILPPYLYQVQYGCVQLSADKWRNKLLNKPISLATIPFSPALLNSGLQHHSSWP